MTTSEVLCSISKYNIYLRYLKKNDIINKIYCLGDANMEQYYKLVDDLQGKSINGWFVREKISSKPSSGGNFSVGYIAVRGSGEEGFLKAMDFSPAFGAPNGAELINAMTDAYLFEKELLYKCTKNRLKHVVKIIDAGQYELPFEQFPKDKPFYNIPVYYLVFEKAENSVRNIIDINETLDISWSLRSLHNVAVGIEEMHYIQIAHQDIKPSNVLLFDKASTSKIGDVGRASALGIQAEHDDFPVAGDKTYSPIEQLYGFCLSDWQKRRFSCDMYMFGNLIMSYFNNISITYAIDRMLPSSARFRTWGDSYEAVLPQIQLAFDTVLNQFCCRMDTRLRDELIEMIRQLCNPDVYKRGDIKLAHLGSQQYSLRKYITKLDYLAKKYEYLLMKRARA